MNCWSPIEFVYDLQLFRLSIKIHIKTVHFKLFCEGVLIYQERVPLELWKNKHYSHEFSVSIGQKSYSITIMFGKTDYVDLSYSVLVNNTLVVGEDPKKLAFLSDMAETQKHEKNPFHLAFIILSPVFTVLISDYIEDQSFKTPQYYLLIWLFTVTIMAVIEILFQELAKVYKSIIAYVKRSKMK